MRITTLLPIAVALIITPARAPGQKIDSLSVVLNVPRDRASDQVVAAFMTNGLSVSNTTPSIIESDQGQNVAFAGVYHRLVRAIMVNNGTSTTVILYGEEKREWGEGNVTRIRIDNRAGGNGGKVWRKMEAVAASLNESSKQDSATAVGQQTPHQ